MDAHTWPPGSTALCCMATLSMPDLPPPPASALGTSAGPALSLGVCEETSLPLIPASLCSASSEGPAWSSQHHSVMR